jgi:tetratricopeptide (TPR) repeat protein
MRQSLLISTLLIVSLGKTACAEEWASVKEPVDQCYQDMKLALPEAVKWDDAHRMVEGGCRTSRNGDACYTIKALSEDTWDKKKKNPNPNHCLIVVSVTTSPFLKGSNLAWNEANSSSERRIASTIAAKIEVIMKHRGTENPVLPAHPEATISVVEAAIPSQAHKDVSAAKELLEKGQDLDKGIQLLQKAAQEYPKYAEAYLLMGVAYGHQNKWSDAASAFDRAIEIDPKYTAAYLALGALDNQQNKFAEAEKPLLTAAELNPDSADVHVQLARTYMGLNRWQDADPHAQKAVQLAPDIAESHVLLGNVLLRKQDALGALREYKESLRLVPNGPLAEPTRQVVSKIEAALKSSQQQTPSK